MDEENAVQICVGFRSNLRATGAESRQEGRRLRGLPELSFLAALCKEQQGQKSVSIIDKYIESTGRNECPRIYFGDSASPFRVKHI
jgi:hypothetical protein